MFSITSAPGAREVTLGIGTAGPLSTAKASLTKLVPGDIVHATSVGGDFLPPRNPETPVLLIAAGAGITPFLAHLSAPRGCTRDTVTLYMSRNSEHLAYLPELQASGARVLARTSEGSSPAAFMEDTGPARIDHDRLLKLVPDITSRHLYVSGSPASVESLRTAARKCGAGRILTDSFAGY